MEQKKSKNVKNTSKKKKFRNTRLFKLLRLALLVIIILIIINVISDLLKKGANTVTLVIGENVPKLKHEVLVDKNNIYLSKDDIAILYDKNIYYNATDKTVITTYNKHIAVLEMDKNTMSVNDTYVQIEGTLREEKGVIYLPFSDMGIVYDFESEYNKEDKVFLVDSISEAKKEAVVLRNGKLQEKPSLFSKKLDKLKKSEYVLVLGTEGKYTRVRSSSRKNWIHKN